VSSGTGTTRPAPVIWRLATVQGLRRENAHACTLQLAVPEWPGHTAGQHVDVRLTAEDGYQAERSYSIASAPESQRLELTIERIDDGEVSPYLADELRAGDELELRGPIGGPFTWRVSDGGPLLLLAGGSGVVPLTAMLRHRAAQHSDVDARLLLSARRAEDLLYADELARLDADVHFTLTRGAPKGWTGFTGRVDAIMLEQIGPPPSQRPLIYVCGPTAFVERAADLLIELGHPPEMIRTERFGPTGQ
jgi:ferredoxin-NADP reductase